MMSLTLRTPTVPLRTDDHGVIRVADTRVSLDSVLAAFCSGETAEQITQNFSSLQLEDVYATIAYYLQNRVEVEAYLDDQRREGTALRETIEENEATQRMRHRLSELHANREV